MMLIEDGDGTERGHYFCRHNDDTPDNRKAAEQLLARQGCTRVVHSTAVSIESDTRPLISYGFIERRDVVIQRAREPRHD